MIYKLKVTVDKVYPQSESMGKGYDEDSAESVYNVEENSLPSFEPDLNFIELLPNASKTDFISSTPLSEGILMNERAKDLLAHFKIGRHAFYKAIIKQASLQLKDNYYWFLQEVNALPYIDFSKSTFYTSDYNPAKKEDEIKFSNAEDFIEKRRFFLEERGKIVSSDSLVIDKKIVDEFDLFRLPELFPGEIFISEQLKKALISNDLTGVNIRPVKTPQTESVQGLTCFIFE